jgi:hypothetical protein
MTDCGNHRERYSGEGNKGVAMQTKNFSPRRIFWTTVTMMSLAGMIILAAVAGALYGLWKAVQYLPWMH